MRTAIVWTLILGALALSPLPPTVAQEPSAKSVYNAVRDTPAKVRWCLPEAGDDPASIISSSCAKYSACLDDGKLSPTVDRSPYVQLQKDALTALQRCHQYLYNAARANPQLKGSKATQVWLTGDVQPGSEAKSFPVPPSMPSPR